MYKLYPCFIAEHSDPNSVSYNLPGNVECFGTKSRRKLLKIIYFYLFKKYSTVIRVL